MASIGEDKEKLEPSHAVGRNAKCVAALENRWVVPQKAKHRVIIWPKPYVSPRELQIHGHTKTGTRAFTAALASTASTQKLLKCLGTDEWINKGDTQAME